MLELIVYMAGVIIMMIAFAIRTPYQDIGAAVILSVFLAIINIGHDNRKSFVDY